jgi:hypothetical protein
MKTRRDEDDLQLDILPFVGGRREFSTCLCDLTRQRRIGFEINVGEIEVGEKEDALHKGT